MSDFKEIFSIIVSHCTEQKSKDLYNCLETIATEAAVPIDKLDMDLRMLQGFGLIKYSMANNHIHLPEIGGLPNMSFKG
jgi:hypothetical protein